jgi:hypothetical protein
MKHGIQEQACFVKPEKMPPQVLEMGKNSVSPWMIPRIKASSFDIIYITFLNV